MKEKIIIFFVGLLVGAVMTTGAFCAYTLVSNNHCKDNNMQMEQSPMRKINKIFFYRLFTEVW